MYFEKCHGVMYTLLFHRIFIPAGLQPAVPDQTDCMYLARYTATHSLRQENP